MQPSSRMSLHVIPLEERLSTDCRGWREKETEIRVSAESLPALQVLLSAAPQPPSQQPLQPLQTPGASVLQGLCGWVHTTVFSGDTATTTCRKKKTCRYRCGNEDSSCLILLVKKYATKTSIFNDYKNNH